MQITDLELHQPERYKGPSDKELDHLDEGDFIMIAYINKEEVWWAPALAAVRSDQIRLHLFQPHQADQIPSYASKHC